MTESLQYGLYASIITTLVPSALLLSLRFYARRAKRIKLWWDDYLAVLALVSAVACDITAFFLTTKGLGLHLESLPVSVGEAQYYEAMGREIMEHGYTIGIGAAQLSLLTLYWRLFKSSSSASIAMFVLTGFVSAWLIMRLLVTVFQCFPPQYLWNKSMDGKCTVNTADYFLWSVSTHLLLDVSLMVLPAIQISRLWLPWPQRTAIGAMFMFGIAVVVASIMMLVVSSKYDSYAADIMWNITPAIIWATVEIHLSVMACCLPVMRPVFRAFGGWWRQNFSSRSGASAASHQPVELEHVHRLAEHNSGESTYNLATTTESNNTTGVDPGQVYGQGKELDTIIDSTGKVKEKPGRDGALVLR